MSVKVPYELQDPRDVAPMVPIVAVSEIPSFKLAGFCSWAGRFEYYLVGTP